jgi:prepilin-type N-terminal cleavage/methylation domain-containing protein
MKLEKSALRKNGAKAFTLIEMIGVLAVIAILAALLIPKIFEAINNARVNNALVSYNTIKAATADHYAKYGGIILSSNGVALGSTTNNYDLQLLYEGFIDKPFITKIGTTSWVQVASASVSQYDLDGDGTYETTNGTYVVEAIIQGVPYNDAKDVNDRLDSATAPFTFPAVGTADTKGRVKYDSAVAGGQLNIYVTHR